MRKSDNSNPRGHALGSATQRARASGSIPSPRVADLDGSCYEPEFAYWTDKKKR